ncbi:uncharacterized protein PAC_16124 [Phialocephala subalpina]|uniref:Uncharacterized protein n=1 Tax=Phialocephala subalpina TaxID=576137 RepID=A0A1L7XMH0_9HELO|nr:uncharacterized protein PAC_16124 [Phialocephala subalpina]
MHCDATVPSLNIVPIERTTIIQKSSTSKIQKQKSRRSGPGLLTFFSSLLTPFIGRRKVKKQKDAIPEERTPLQPKTPKSQSQKRKPETPAKRAGKQDDQNSQSSKSKPHDADWPLRFAAQRLVGENVVAAGHVLFRR